MITHSGIRSYPLVNDGVSYFDTLYCINAQSHLTDDPDHRVIAFNHIEAHTSFNWLTLSGNDFFVNNWTGDTSAATLEYTWTT